MCDKIPFIASGNDELSDKEDIGDTVVCVRCGELHRVKYGVEISDDTTKTPSKLLAFVDCGGSTYLVGVNGKRI